MSWWQIGSIIYVAEYRQGAEGCYCSCSQRKSHRSFPSWDHISLWRCWRGCCFSWALLSWMALDWEGCCFIVQGHENCAESEDIIYLPNVSCQELFIESNLCIIYFAMSLLIMFINFIWSQVIFKIQVWISVPEVVIRL